MTKILRSKRTWVAVGVVILSMVFGLWANVQSSSEWNEKKIKLAERLVNNRCSLGTVGSLALFDVEVRGFGYSKLTLQGRARLKYEDGIYSAPFPVKYRMENEDSIWKIANWDDKPSVSLWDPIKNYFTSFLP